MKMTEQAIGEVAAYLPPPPVPNTSSEIVAVGRQLITAKEILKGEFTSWVEAHCDFTPRSASRYMARAKDAGSGFTANPDTFARITAPVMPDWPSVTTAEIDIEVKEIECSVFNFDYDQSEVDAMCEPAKFAADIADRLPNATPTDIITAIDRAVMSAQPRIETLKRVREFISSLPDQQAMLWHTDVRDEIKMSDQEMMFAQFVEYDARDMGIMHCQDVAPNQRDAWWAKVTGSVKGLLTEHRSEAVANDPIWAKVQAMPIAMPEFPFDDDELTPSEFAHFCGDMLCESVWNQVGAIVRVCVFDDWDTWRRSKGLRTYDELEALSDPVYHEFARRKLGKFAMHIAQGAGFDSDSDYRLALEGFWPEMDELVPYVVNLSLGPEKMSRIFNDALADLINDNDDGDDAQARRIKLLETAQIKLYETRIDDVVNRWSALRVQAGLSPYDQLPADQQKIAYEHCANFSQWSISNSMSSEKQPVTREQFEATLRQYWPTDDDETEIPF